MPNDSTKTHLEDVEDPDEVLLPTHNLLFVTFCEDESGHSVPFPLLDNLPPDPPPRLYDCGIPKFIERTTDETHEVRPPIASSWLSPSDRFPSISVRVLDTRHHRPTQGRRSPGHCPLCPKAI